MLVYLQVVSVNESRRRTTDGYCCNPRVWRWERGSRRRFEQSTIYTLLSIYALSASTTCDRCGTWRRQHNHPSHHRSPEFVPYLWKIYTFPCYLNKFYDRTMNVWVRASIIDGRDECCSSIYFAKWCPLWCRKYYFEVFEYVERLFRCTTCQVAHVLPLGVRWTTGVHHVKIWVVDVYRFINGHCTGSVRIEVRAELDAARNTNHGMKIAA